MGEAPHIPSTLDIRYVVFLIDSQYEQHEGIIFMSIEDAREYGYDALKEHMCNSVIIGWFVWENDNSHIYMHKVEKFNLTQMKKCNTDNLFKP